ncbi:MAG: hypothetical protein RLZZ46_1048 [Bacteroidota bacterium]|jgi:glycosyltransferase involved in cell wall biosynthesis
MKKFLVLYRELASYFVACLNDYCERYQVKAEVIAYPVNPDAPFKFSFSPYVVLHDRLKLSNEDIIEKARSGEFEAIFCGGWADKVYLEAVKKRQSAVALLGFDNQWQGGLKQHMACIYARIFLTPYFDFAFVPGPEQQEFARRMGFKSVSQGAYSCDYPIFDKIYNSRHAVFDGEKRRLIYTGRYASEKYFLELCEIFTELRNEGFSHWELHAAGTGPLWDQRINHPAVFHHGFLQPEALKRLMLDGHAFVLPSVFEPWGVVVHEFAAAGYPLILSDKVGARTAFLVDGKNGYLFNSGNRTELKNALRKMMGSSNEALLQMSRVSHLLASSITPESWSKTIHDQIKNKRQTS